MSRVLWAAAAGGSAAAYWKFTNKQQLLLVYYKGEAYDVSGFAAMHPGGADLLLGAVGKDLEPFFEAYSVHQDNEMVSGLLEGMKLEGTQGRGKQYGSQQHAICSNKNWLGRYFRVFLVALTLPLWVLIRAFYRASGGPAWLPISTRHRQQQGTKEVAVIGGGIAGCGAAYALKKAGHNVTIYEAKPTLGGNASTFQWSLGGGNYVKTGLAVLAWPVKYFKNYTALLEELSVDTVKVELPFFIQSKVQGCEGVFAQADDVDEGSLRTHFSEDLKRWDAVVAGVRGVNEFFCGQEPSLYSASYWNPLNVISLKTLLRLCGCSREFWDVIVVSQYGSSFLTPELDGVPALILPTIDDLIPLTRASGSTAEDAMESWSGTSEVVFSKMTLGCTVKTASRVLAVDPSRDGKIDVIDGAGEAAGFDNVVFACNASAVGSILQSKSWVEEALLRGVSYTDDSSISWMKAYAHQDTSVFPAEWEARICDKYATYVEVSRDSDDYAYGQHFTVGAWYHTNQAYGDAKQPLIVSHGMDKEPSPDKLQGVVTHARAHPDLCFSNLLISQLMSLVQGRRGIYYCSSYTTPGNGHDLSLLSGLIAAAQIGAPYPFLSNEAAHRDFKRLESLMYPF